MALQISGFTVTLEKYNNISEIWWYVKEKDENLKTLILTDDDVDLELDVNSDFTNVEIADRLGLSLKKQLL